MGYRVTTVEELSTRSENRYFLHVTDSPPSVLAGGSDNLLQMLFFK